jgi:5-deoxy-glucuronate isomerase
MNIEAKDTIKILDQKDHAQVSAPGYGMFYVWSIRHLTDLPYGVPIFTEEHVWTKEKTANDRVRKSTIFA